MDAVVVAAIVAGVVSILVATGKAGWDARQRKQERGVATRAKLDRYREPLLGAVDELGNRIDNIRNKRFFVYLGTDRRNLALRSTLFRIGEYFAWVEILYGTSGQYRFTLDEKTKEVASKIRLAGATFASDKHDQVVPTDFRTTRLMLWREEQRAIGEVMRIRGRDPGCIGFDAFDLRKSDNASFKSPKSGLRFNVSNCLARAYPRE